MHGFANLRGVLCVQTHQQRIGNSSKLKRTPTKHAIYAEAHVIHFLIFAIRLKQTTNFYRLHKQMNERAREKNIRKTKHGILGIHTHTKNVPRTIASTCSLLQHFDHKHSCCLCCCCRCCCMTSGE